jgi:hypothetical protein
MAARFNRGEVVKILLSHGADAMAKMVIREKDSTA